MKYLKEYWIPIVGALMVAMSIAAVAVDFPPASSQNTYDATLMSATTTNLTVTFTAERFYLHTFQFTYVATNAVSNVISGSLDGVGWVPLSTNSASASATNGVTLTQRWSQIKVQYFTAANASTNTVLYLGSR